MNFLAGSAEMVVNGIKPIEKILHLDLNAVGYNKVQKVEGLTLIVPGTLAVINDNDVGVANIIVNPDGTFTLTYTPDPIQLGIIETNLNGSGQLVFDSGDALELITADVYPSNFNASNTSNTFDDRSDDKGPEPEGVVPQTRRC